MQDPQSDTNRQTPPGWHQPAADAGFIHRYFAFDNWREALDFIELVLYLGEQAGLLPGVVICGSRVAVRVEAEEVQFARSLDPLDGAGNP